MLRLNTTTRKLQVLLSGAITTNQLPVMVCYSDKTAASYNGGTQLANTNNATAVDICAAPAASTVRDIDSINIYNRDTAAATVSVIYNDNATTYILLKATLAVGDQLIYTHGQGWKVVDSTGSVKSGGGISGPIAALSVTNTPAGSISATTVQAAINELDSEKANAASPSTSGTLTHSGDVVLSGLGKRITGDFSNATIANRVMFQNSVPNQPSNLHALPNGVSTVAGILAFGNSDPANTNFASFQSIGVETKITSGITGSGTYAPITVTAYGAEKLRIDNTQVAVTSPIPLGYGIGSGGTVTQATSNSTAVTLNKPSGRITTAADALASNAVVAFSLNNSLISNTDTLSIGWHENGMSGDSFQCWSMCTYGKAYIYIRNISLGSLAQALSINFAIIKGVVS